MNTDIEFLEHLRLEFVRIGEARPVSPPTRGARLPRADGFRRIGGAAAAAGLLAVVTWTAWITVHPQSHSGPASAVTTYRLATPGTPIPLTRMSALAQDLLASDRSIGGAASIDVLGTTAGRAFYEINGTNGATCFGSGPATTHGVSDLACPLPGMTLLDLPIVSLSGLGEVAIDPTSARILSSPVLVYGVAASAVSSVVVTTATGGRVSVPVVGDVYELPANEAPSGQLCSISAVDRAGRTIWTTGDICA